MDYLLSPVNILSVNEKLPVSKFRYFGKYIIQLFAMLVNDKLDPWNYSARDAREFYVFRSF